MDDKQYENKYCIVQSQEIIDHLSFQKLVILGKYNLRWKKTHKITAFLHHINIYISKPKSIFK